MYCNILTKVINEAKKMYYNKRIVKSTNKIKTTWNIINEILDKQVSPNDIMKLSIENNHYANQYDIVNIFNQHFSSVVDKLNINNTDKDKYIKSINNHHASKSIQNQFPYMVYKSFSTQETINIIKSLKSKDSYGYDKISTRLLKISANYMSSPLSHIINNVISSGIFPQRLKYSIIILLYKKGDKTEPPNYRPISLPTSFSKVFEKALYKRLIEYLGKNNVLNKEQFGFRMKHATEDAILKLTHEILNALNKNLKVCGIFCDLEKAFDSVNPYPTAFP